MEINLRKSQYLLTVFIKGIQGIFWFWPSRRSVGLFRYILPLLIESNPTSSSYSGIERSLLLYVALVPTQLLRLFGVRKQFLRFRTALPSFWTTRFSSLPFVSASLQFRGLFPDIFRWTPGGSLYFFCLQSTVGRSAFSHLHQFALIAAEWNAACLHSVITYSFLSAV